MKKIIIPLIFLLLLTLLRAKDLNVLIDKRKTSETINFLENYAIVINQDHYYGPFSKDNSLTVKIFDPSKTTNGEIQLLVNFIDENGTKRSKDLVRTSQRIDIVQSFENGIDFSQTISFENAKTSNPINSEDINFTKLAQNKKPFFKYNRYNKKNSWVEFTGPLSLYVRGEIQNSFYMVEAVPLEDYLVHVVNCELRGAQNMQAYKAQAILSRTFALYQLEIRTKIAEQQNSWINYQIQGNQSDQAYVCYFRANNANLPNEMIKTAVEETKGLVLKDSKNKLIDVHYQAHCGSCTACKANSCTPTNGLGCCQEKLLYYAREFNYSYDKILHNLYSNANIALYDDLGYNPVELNELEQSLMDTEKRLQQMI